ncbi:efflux RND transporter permease subunit [Nisaea sp.]|uniref:efflux RND transporter permease subunit n=1 Tax=Nisaea sp. TaxID=2024842 RepID=UPI0032EB5171
MPYRNRLSAPTPRKPTEDRPMHALIDAALHRSRTTLMVLFLILVSGAVAYVTIPKEADPDVNIPIVYVAMKHDGISPEDAERLLLKPMESELRGIEGVKEMRATAYEGGANVTLEFTAGFDADQAMLDVREKVDLAKPELPEETDEPTVHEVNVSLFPILVVTLSGALPERTMLHLARNLRDEIEGITTVLEAKLTGEREELVEIIIDPLRLDSYNIDAAAVLEIVARSNQLVAAGTLDTGNGRFPIKVPGLYENLQDILNQPIKTNGDAVVRVRDVAYVERGFKDREALARLDGRPAIGIEVTKRIGENVIETVEKIRAIVAETQKAWPNGVNVTFSQDKSGQIRIMLTDLRNNVLSAVLLVMIVIVGALGIRSAGLVGIAIPGSFLLGILTLSSLGLTVNIVVLFSLILAVGMLVDGAIVVTEYADRKLSEGLDRRAAYSEAAKRMAWPIIASTATTLAAFLPLLFWPGVVGEFMKFLPITLIATLSASLFMALLFVPALGSIIGKAGAQSPESQESLAAMENGDLNKVRGFTGGYLKVLQVALNNPGKVILAAVALLVGVQYYYANHGNGIEFFPDVEPDNAMIHVHARGNMSTAEKARLVLQIEKEVLDVGGFKSTYTFVGDKDSGGQDLAEDVIGTIQVEFMDWQERRPADVILADIAARAKAYPGIFVETAKEEGGPPTGKAVQVQLRSNYPDRLTEATTKIRAQFDNMTGLQNIEDDRHIPGIEWQIDVDRAQAAKFGADIALIGSYVQFVTRGLKVSDFRPNDSDEEIDIVVRYPRPFRRLDQFLSIRMVTDKGLVPLRNFVTWSPQAKVGTIKRSDARQVMSVKADVLPGVLADEKVQELTEWLAKTDLPAGVSYKFKGEDEEQKAAQAFLGKAFGIALFIMAIILVTQFNSFYSAFLILSAVIMSTIGVMIGLMVTGQPFGIVMSGIGVIALAGIVVNNNIVLIDTFDALKTTTGSTMEAILRTGAQRLRPVMLTTVTTMLGLLPMVLQTNIDLFTREVSVGAPSTQWWVALSSAIVFGMGFATILTLIVTPSALQLRSNFREWWTGSVVNRRERDRFPDNLPDAPETAEQRQG